MSRIRTYKPEFWSSESLARDLTRDQRLLYLGLITEADDEGRFLTAPRRLIGAIFPFDEDLEERWVQESLDLLERTGRLVQYRVEGRAYAFLTHFSEHQVICRPSKSRLPPPPARCLQVAADRAQDAEKKQEPSCDSQGTLTEASCDSADGLTEPSGETAGTLTECSCNSPGPLTEPSCDSPATLNEDSMSPHSNLQQSQCLEVGSRNWELGKGISPPSPLPGGATSASPIPTSSIPTQPSPAPTSGTLFPDPAPKRRERAATEAEKAAADQVADLWRRLMVPAGFPSLKTGAWKLATLLVVARAGEDLEATEALFRRVRASKFLSGEMLPDLLWVLKDGRERIEMGRFDRGGGGSSAAAGKPWMVGIDLDGLSAAEVSRVEKDALMSAALGADTAKQLREAHHAL
jgi:hypothetical protein